MDLFVRCDDIFTLWKTELGIYTQVRETLVSLAVTITLLLYAIGSPLPLFLLSTLHCPLQLQQ
jgi:hypothetical protein